MTKTQSIVEKINKGDIEAILSGVASKTPIIQLNSIIEGTKLQIKDDSFIQSVRNASESNVTLLGVPLYAIATASLDILGVERYSGNEDVVKK